MTNKIGVSLNIDVTKIDKARLHKGEKGTYLDSTVFIDVNNVDQYGNNGFIAQSVSKEEREQGVRGEILGNVKVFFKEGGKSENSTAQNSNFNATTGQPTADNFDDEIQF